MAAAVPSIIDDWMAELLIFFWPVGPIGTGGSIFSGWRHDFETKAAKIGGGG